MSYAKNFKGISLILPLFIFIIFLVQYFYPSFTSFFLLSPKSFPQIYRFITSIFLHKDIKHLLDNLIFLIIFGLYVEGIMGWKRYLQIFLIGGIIGNISMYLYDPSGYALGCSGSVMALLGALTIAEPLMPIYAYTPMPVIVFGAIYFLLDVIGFIYPTDNIGYIAHIFGFLSGGIFGYLYRKEKKEKERKKKKGIEISDREIEEWENKMLSF